MLLLFQKYIAKEPFEDYPYVLLQVVQMTTKDQQIKQQVYDAANLVQCVVSLNNYFIGERTQWDGVTSTEIAQAMGLTVSYATKCLKIAEELGFVVRSTKRKGGWMHVSHVEQSQNPEFVPVAPPREVLKVA